MKACTRWAPLLGAREGELGDADARGLADHLASCNGCQARLADAAALSGMLSAALMGEANRRDFSGFADGVMARIPSARPWAAPPRGGASPERGRRAQPERVPQGWLAPIADWVRHHRFAAIASALAPAVAALALVLYLGRGPAPEYAVEVSSDDRGAMVLETNEGPVVLLGDSNSDGT
jgi:hypothetical protein